MTDRLENRPKAPHTPRERLAEARKRAREQAKHKSTLRKDWMVFAFVGLLILAGILTRAHAIGTFVVALPGHIGLWAHVNRYGLELVGASLGFAVEVVAIWRIRHYLRWRAGHQEAVVLADVGMRPIDLTFTDLYHHAHFIGPTGSGKTVALENVFKGFVLNRRTAGVFIDPKDGEAVRWLLRTIPNSEEDRVVLIRPDDDQVVGLNLLEVAPGENAEMVADQTVAVFRRVLQRMGGANGWGTRMDVVLRMAVLTLMKHPGSTLCDLPALLGPDREARRRWTKGLDDPIGLEPFWADYDPKKAGVEPVVARIQGLLVRPSVRAMLGQTESTIDLGRILDEHGILLVDIAKGRIGEDVSALLGSFMVARLWQISQRRARTPEERRHPAVVVADEFQNFVDGGDKLTEILTESRAYRVGWFLAHQFRHQVPESVWHAVESCTLTKVQLHGPDRRKQYRATIRRRLMPDVPVLAATRARHGDLGAEHGEQLAEHALQRWGTPRTSVEEALRRRLGRLAVQAGPEDELEDAEHQKGVQEAPRRPQLTPEYLAHLRAQTYELILLGQVPRRPRACERCHRVPKRGDQLQVHHWDYSDPANISWYCRKCHLEADRERRAEEDPTDVRGFTDERVQAMMERRRQRWGWEAIGAEVGLTYQQARRLCERRFPDDPVWNRRGAKRRPGRPRAKQGQT